MLHNEKNSNSVGTQQNQPEDSFDLNKTMQNLPNSDIANDHKKLKERMTDLLKGDTEFSKMKQGDKILVVSTASGLFTAVLPLLAVGATLAIPGAIVGLALYFAVKVAVKAVQSGYKGLKWSAEKTVDGAKYTAGKVKDASTYAAGKVRDGAMHVKDKVKEGYEHSVDSLKKGASFVGEGVANKFHKASGETDYLDKVKRFTPDAIKKSDEIRNDMKAIFADKGNNSGLVKNILSGISSEIDLKMAEKAKSGEIEHTSGWQIQKEFINNLNEKSLHNLLTQRSLPKGSYFIDSVFSEHHDEIKKVIKECRENHLYSSVSNMFDRAEKKANRPSVKSLTRSVSSSFSSLGRKGSEQSNSLSKSNSLNSIGTESTATVSDSDSQNFATVRRSNSSSSLTPKLTPVAPPELPRSASLTNLNGQSSCSEDVLSDPIVEQNLDSLSNRTLTHSNSTDSGMGSGSSMLTRKQVLPLKEEFDRELEEKLAKRRASLDQPSAEPVNSRATATPGTV
ncbi:actin bundler [Wolbachia endosymbiont of Rhagoletis cingulata]|uniref:actin bundler n=1 Tax=Wolbachia endosymbiont of Rhagoletis cingulata TaxID=1220542 RepID=UPI003AF393C3